ncbi:sterol carrier protein 2 [Moniliophthora roreri MCA 2997]|uniref:Sterol carrier protein 2 n=2 Tax=Moniliophthora roreri TaxID=221103 RepID=V2XGS7_MONRO|nr:sterol carrier protein 2 [Moniliophthora roreri MCA 2997]KAI3615427.1 sterol carrier protein 2 [Moniliophthora roreri]
MSGSVESTTSTGQFPPTRKGRRTFLIGGGCTAFIKPRATRTTEDMGLEAATKALLDAGITYDEVEQAVVGYVYGDSTCGQRALYNLGLTGIPITNVNNNCSTGSTALFHANNSVKYGQAECALALGFERMKPGSLGTNFPDRPPPTLLLMQRTIEIEQEVIGENHGPGAPRQFSDGAKEYFMKYGANMEHLARIASKNHKHSVNNPYSQFRDGWSVEQVLKAPKITNELTKFMCSPTSDGAACCIVVSEDFVHKHHLENQAIEIVAQALTTDYPAAFESKSAMEVVGYSMTKNCADEVFSQAGFDKGEGRDQVGVVELHDCFAANELIMYPALGLCKENEAHKMVEKGDNTYGGKYVINPSGGLEAKGHPLGATGLGMHFYIMMQLRNWAGPMQAPGLFDISDQRGKYGLVHNVGLGGAVVCSLLRRPEFYKPGGQDGRDRVGYNHAHEYRTITMADVDKVKSKANSKYVLRHAKL